MGNLYLTEADDLSQKTLDISTWNSSLGNLLMIFELLFANLCHFCMENFFVDERCHRHVRWANDDWELNDVNLNDCDWLRNISPLQRGILWISKCHIWTKINNKRGIFGNYTWISTKPIKTCPRHSLYLSEGLQEQQWLGIFYPDIY